MGFLFSSLTRLFFRLLTLALFFSFLDGVSAAAQQELDLVSEGMSYGQVLMVWGAPLEKQQFEVKREDLWIYNEVEVRFKEGKVTLAKYREGAEMTLAEEKSEVEQIEEEASAAADSNTVAVEDILSEIMDGTAGTPAKADDGQSGKVAPLPRELLSDRLITK